MESVFQGFRCLFLPVRVLEQLDVRLQLTYAMVDIILCCSRAREVG